MTPTLSADEMVGTTGEVLVRMMKRCEDLAAENARLRYALKEIAKMPLKVSSLKPMRETARQALGERNDQR